MATPRKCSKEKATTGPGNNTVFAGVVTFHQEYMRFLDTVLPEYDRVYENGGAMDITLVPKVRQHVRYLQRLRFWTLADEKLALRAAEAKRFFPQDEWVLIAQVEGAADALIAKRGQVTAFNHKGNEGNKGSRLRTRTY